jgi:hypothetical protein
MQYKRSNHNHLGKETGAIQALHQKIIGFYHLLQKMKEKSEKSPTSEIMVTTNVGCQVVDTWLLLFFGCRPIWGQ